MGRRKTNQDKLERKAINGEYAKAMFKQRRSLLDKDLSGNVYHRGDIPDHRLNEWLIQK